MDKKNVAALILVAALGGFILGRLSENLNSRFPGAGGGGVPEAVESNLADHELEDPGAEQASSDRVPIDGAPFIGGASAKVNMVVFSEFQCPFSRRVLGSLQELMEEYEDDELRITFLNFPLSFHEYAQPSAEAALAAHAQGAFWPYHDMLFNNQLALDPASLLAYAEELDLDMAAFRAAIDGGTFTDQVAAEQSLGQRFGIRGTPSMLINGRLVVGAKPAADFRAIIDAELEAADDLLDDDVPLREIYQRRVAENLPAEAEQGAAPRTPAPSAPTVSPVPRPREGRGQSDGGPVEVTVYADVATPEFALLGPTLNRLSQEFGDRLTVDVQELPAADDAARRRGVVATPAIFIGDERLVGAVPYPDLREMIDSALAER